MSENEHLHQPIFDYLIRHSAPVEPLVEELVAETQQLGRAAGMQLGVEQAALLAFLVGLLQARFVVEIGTFTGLSSLMMARALPGDGQIVCCDISADYTAIAERYWRRAGVADRITLRIGDARETLRSLSRAPHIDLAFIDADKPGYIDYYEALVPRLRPGGLLIADNIFMGGDVVDPETGSMAAAMVEFIEHAQGDPRTETVLVPIGDGFAMSRLID